MYTKKLVQSKLVNLDITSNLNSEKLEIKNAWVVDSLKLPPKCLNFDQVKHSHAHLTDLDFSNVDVDSDISILIGADNPMLHIYIRKYA